MMAHDEEIKECKENHCVLSDNRVDKTAAYTEVPTITLQLDVANNLPNRL